MGYGDHPSISHAIAMEEARTHCSRFMVAQSHPQRRGLMEFGALEQDVFLHSTDPLFSLNQVWRAVEVPTCGACSLSFI